MWQLRCITTWGRPTPRQSLCALITKPITTHARAKFEIAQPHCRFIAFYCWYVTWRCDLELWPRELMPIQTNVVILQSYLTKTTYFLHLRLQPPKKTAYTSYFSNTLAISRTRILSLACCTKSFTDDKTKSHCRD